MNLLRIAIQKSGRLSDKSKSLLKECGISIPDSKRTLKIRATNFPMEVLLLRDDDIPQYVQDGIADLGILGLNEVEEKDKDVDIVKHLGFSKCKLCLAIPEEKVSTYERIGLSWFEGKKIATSYPNVLTKRLLANNINIQVHEIGGSVEIAPTIGLSDGIFDIVSTGATLRNNGLAAVETLMKSEAVLIANRSLNASNKNTLDDLLFRIKAVLNAKNKKYVMLNALKNKLSEVTKLLPATTSPTVMALEDADWVAIHTVMTEDDFWKVVRPLEQLGATGILSINIEKIIPE